MIVLLIVGCILLIVGYMAPLPAPLPILFRMGGAICLVVAVILLVVALLNGAVVIGT